MLLAVLAGRDPEERVGGAPADQARCKRYDAEIAPWGPGTDKCEGQDHCTCHNSDNPFTGTDILFHAYFLLGSFVIERLREPP